MSIEDAIDIIAPDALGFTSVITDIFNNYQNYKREHGMFDFDDLLEVVNDGLKNNPEFCQAVQSNYDYIMVDEFQDTNICQNSIVSILSARHKNIMVVGDDSQSIYAFRGAHVENILRFPSMFPGCKIIKLEQNYRSSQNILNLVNSVNDSFCVGYKKYLYSNKTNGPKPKLMISYSADDEAKFTVQQIKKSIAEGNKPNQHAVLFRSSFHSLILQNEFMKNRIPFVMYGGIKFAEKRHIKDMSAFIKICVNNKDSVAWGRALNLIEGVGKKTSQDIIKTMSKNMSDVASYEKKVFYGQLSRLVNIAIDFKETNDSDKMLNSVLNFYLPVLERIEDDFQKRQGDIDIFVNLAKESQNLTEFIGEFVLEPPSRIRNNGSLDKGDDDAVILSTVHSAKGLEWHTVFVCHLLDGLFPSYRSFNDMVEIEEERRLFYVATSRAKERLFLTMPSSVASRTAIFNLPSRFIRDIGDHFYE